MSKSRNIAFCPFHGFTDKLDLTNPAEQGKFIHSAEDWIEELVEMCIGYYRLSKADTFDAIVSFLHDESKEWYNMEFTHDDKFRFKNLKNLIMKFKSRYCKLDQLPTKSANESIQMLVERIRKLEPLAQIIEKQEVIINQQSQSISLLQSKIQNFSLLEERVTKLQQAVLKIAHDAQPEDTTIDALNARIFQVETQLSKMNRSKCDTFKSLRDKQNHLKNEIATLTPAIKEDTAKLQGKMKEVEDSCHSHQNLLADLQAKIASLSLTGSPEISVVVPKPVPVKETSKHDCERCGASTHSSASCGARWLKCRQCWQVGHLARCCQSTKCQRCGLTTHTTEECRASHVYCWQCGHKGHLHRMCPLLQSDNQRRYQVT